MATTYAPQWLQVEDIKSWLRLNQQDTSDDDLLTMVAAMAEPYVERCRPDGWTNPGAPSRAEIGPAALDTATGDNISRVDLWLDAHPIVPPPVRGVARSYSFTVDDTLQPDAEWWVQLPMGDYPFALQVWDAAGVVLTGRYLAAAAAGQLAVWLTPSTADDGPAHLTADSAERINTYAPDAEAYTGGVMYAAREYRRRNSPAGIEMFGETASFVTRYDTDIERALHTGSWAPPVTA